MTSLDQIKKQATMFQNKIKQDFPTGTNRNCHIEADAQRPVQDHNLSMADRSPSTQFSKGRCALYYWNGKVKLKLVTKGAKLINQSVLTLFTISHFNLCLGDCILIQGCSPLAWILLL